MGQAFDPYYNWLGIPEGEQPPNHYRLLGLAPLEANPSVIEHAADRVMIHLRTFAAGPHGTESQRLLNEVASARVCLLSAERKGRYDAELQARLGLAPAAAATRTLPRAAGGANLPKAAALPSMGVSSPVTVIEEEPVIAVNRSALAVDTAAASSRKFGRGRKPNAANPEAAAILNFVKIVMGGLGGLSVAILLVWVVFRVDAFGLFPVDDQQQAQNPPNPPVPPDDPPKPDEPMPPPTPNPPAPPDDSPKPDEPMPPPTPNPAAPADGRHPVPTGEQQKAKLEELKSIYSKQFEEAERPSVREKFPEFLLTAAGGIKSDPVARYVLYREAYLKLIAAKDFSLAVEVVDRMEQEFTVDPFTSRIHTLTEASKAGRQTAAEKQAIVLCAADLAELAVGRQRTTDALKLARLAENLGKSLQSQPLRARTVALKAEVEKAQADWGPVERARQTLATDPKDPAAALVDGRYRCLVAGDWASGMPILALAGEDPLAVAARKDLAGPSESQSAAAIADAWFDLAKGDEKLKPCYARALHWYRQAVANSTGAEQVPWLQRVELIESLKLPERYFATPSSASTNEPLPTFVSMYFRNFSFAPIDCFKFVTPLELKASLWTPFSSTSPSIYSNTDIVYGRVPSHVPNIPREYQVVVRVGQYYASGQRGPLVIGLVGPKGQFAAVIDLPISSTEYCTFLTLADAKTPEQNPTLARYSRQHVKFGDEPVQVAVRRNSVTVWINNRVVSQYDGDLSKLALPREWTVADPKALLVGAHQGSYRVSSWTVEAVAPAPRLGPSASLPAVPGLPEFEPPSR